MIKHIKDIAMLFTTIVLFIICHSIIFVIVAGITYASYIFIYCSDELKSSMKRYSQETIQIADAIEADIKVIKSYLGEETLNYIHSIVKDEGFRGVPYKDTMGIMTVGYGKNMKEQWSKHALQAEAYRSSATKVKQLQSSLPWTNDLDPRGKRVVLNQTYNMGVNKLKTFKTYLADLQKHEYSLASSDLLKTLYCKQVGNRCKKEQVTILESIGS